MTSAERDAINRNIDSLDAVAMNLGNELRATRVNLAALRNRCELAEAENDRLKAAAAAQSSRGKPKKK